MQDKTLFTVAIAGSIIGLAILFILSKTLTLTPSENLDIPDGKKIAIEGTITRVQNLGTITKLTIRHTCNTDAIIFDNSTIEPSYARITGTLQTYKGKKEVIVDKIEKIKQE